MAVQIFNQVDLENLSDFKKGFYAIEGLDPKADEELVKAVKDEIGTIKVNNSMAIVEIYEYIEGVLNA